MTTRRTTRVTMSAAEREQAEQERRAALEALHETLRAAVDRIESGADWQAWLAFARGLHQYSFRNLMLIRQQRPDATAVASYRTWQANGRQVRKGEKALRVLAPIIHTTRTQPRTNQNAPEAAEPADGTGPDRDVGEVVRRRVVAYKAVPVFDIGQTDGDPVTPPAPQLLAGHAPAGLWDALLDEAVARGYRVTRADPADLGGANGITDFHRREISIRHDVDDAQAVKTLAHELGHVLLHGHDTDTGSGPDTHSRVRCRGVVEVEAESVAYLVTGHHGVDAAGYSFPYIAAWAYAPAAADHVPIGDIVTRTGERVMAAAGQLIAATAHLPAAEPDPAGQALTARITRATTRCEQVRDETAALAAATGTASEEDLQIIRGILADSQAFFRQDVGASWVPAYLADRGLYDTLADRGLGHAPAGWTGLVDHLRGLGYTDRHIEASGIASRARNGGLIDRFRDRLTIPIHDLDQTLVGFAGRAHPTDTDPRTPKYINTPTTPLFDKSTLLYGAGHHRDAIGAGAVPVLCEGPLDAFAVDTAASRTGTPFVGIAAGGTALTNHQARQLGQLVDGRRIHLAYDADPAGQRATANSWRRFADTGTRYVYAAELPNGQDPADLVRNQQAAELVTALINSRPAAIVVTDHWLAGIPDTDTNLFRQVGAMRLLLDDHLPRIPDDEQQPYLEHLTDALRLDPATVTAEAARIRQAGAMDAVDEHCRSALHAIPVSVTQLEDGRTILPESRVRGEAS